MTLLPENIIQLAEQFINEIEMLTPEYKKHLLDSLPGYVEDINATEAAVNALTNISGTQITKPEIFQLFLRSIADNIIGEVLKEAKLSATKLAGVENVH